MSELLQMEDLPTALRRVLQPFLNKQLDKQDPNNATGECAWVSGLLARWLRFHSSYYAEEVDWGFEEDPYETGEDIILLSHGPRLPSEVERIYVGPPYLPAHRTCLGHTAALVDRTWFIDLTARQFTPTSPWPLIWKSRLPNGELRGPPYVLYDDVDPYAAVGGRDPMHAWECHHLDHYDARH